MSINCMHSELYGQTSDLLLSNTWAIYCNFYGPMYVKEKITMV